MGRSAPLNVCRLVTHKSLCQYLALSHTYCQVFLCHINSQLSLKDLVSCLVLYSKERPAATCLSMCLKGVMLSPLRWLGAMSACRLHCSQQTLFLHHLLRVKENTFQDVPGHVAMLRGMVHIPLHSPAWHLTWLSHSPLKHLTTPSGLQVEINRALEKCALKWQLVSD